MTTLTCQRRRSLYIPVVAKLTSTVVHGFKRGRSIGFRTANLDTEGMCSMLKILPTGVYMGWATVNREQPAVPAVVSVSKNPTFNLDKLNVEAHLLKEFENEFYGEDINLVLTGFMRPDMKFNGLDELKESIAGDVQFAKDLLKDPRTMKYSTDEFLFSKTKTLITEDYIDQSAQELEI